MENIKAFLTQSIKWDEVDVDKLLTLIQAESFDEMLCTAYLNKIVWDLQEKDVPAETIISSLTKLVNYILNSPLPVERKTKLEGIILELINILLLKKSD